MDVGRADRSDGVKIHTAYEAAGSERAGPQAPHVAFFVRYGCIFGRGLGQALGGRVVSQDPKKH